MKHRSILLLYVFFSLLSAELYPQDSSKYVFGSVFYGHLGIYLDASGKTVNTRALDAIYKDLRFKGYYVSTGDIPTLMELLTNYSITKNKNNTIFYRLPHMWNGNQTVAGIEYLSSSIYLPFDEIQRAGQPGAESLIYGAHFNTNYSASPVKLIENAFVSPLKSDGLVNLGTIRPYPINTDDNAVTNTSTANFFLKIKLSNVNCSGKLFVKLSNQYSEYSQKTTDPNYMPLYKELDVIEGSTLQFEIPFGLLCRNGNSPVFSAYEFAPKIEIWGQLSSGSFDLDNIIICDFLGNKLCEDATFNPFNCTEYNQIFNIVNNNTELSAVFQLTDEPVLGNFRPMKKIIEKVKLAGLSNPKFFWIGFDGHMFFPNNNIDLVYKYIQTILEPVKQNIVYHMQSDYPFHEAGNYYTEIWDQFNRYKAERELMSAYLPETQIVGLPQASKIGDSACIRRNPTQSELLAEAYNSFLNGHKGVLFYKMGPSFYENGGQSINPPNQDIYKSFYLSPTLAPGGIIDNGALAIEIFNQMSNVENMYPEKRNALKQLIGFLESNNSGTPQGEILRKAQFISSDLIGIQSSSSYLNLKIYSSEFMDNSSTVSLKKISLLDPATGEILSSGSSLIGVAKYVLDGVAYYLFADLNNNTPFNTNRIRIELNNFDATNCFIKVTDLTNLTVNGRYYPSGCNVLLSIPAHGAILLKVEKSNVGTNGFPLGQNFGVIRSTGNFKSVLALDTDYNGSHNVFMPIASDWKELSIWCPNLNTPANAFAAGATTYRLNADGLVQPKLYFNLFDITNKTTFQTAKKALSFYTQEGYQDFSKLKIQPITGDFDNDAQEEFGCDIKYLNASSLFVHNIYYVDISPTNVYSLKFLKSYTSKKSASDEISVFGRWEAGKTPSAGVYRFTSNGYGEFCFDINNDGIFDSNPSIDKIIPMGVVNNFYPVVGNWAKNLSGIDDGVSEYGIYGINNPWYDSYATLFLNFYGKDTYSYFEFPYGNGMINGNTDKPVVWNGKYIKEVQNPIDKTKGMNGSDSEKMDISETSIVPYPNPFNPQTTFRVVLQKTDYVKLVVYNMLGKEVATIIDSHLEAGDYSFGFNGTDLASGIYIYMLQTSSKSISGKLMLIK